MDWQTICEALGATLGLLGAALVTSMRRERRLVAFAVWVVSNLALIVLFVSLGRWFLVTMQAGYLGTALAGC